MQILKTALDVLLLITLCHVALFTINRAFKTEKYLIGLNKMYITPHSKQDELEVLLLLYILNILFDLALIAAWQYLSKPAYIFSVKRDLNKIRKILHHYSKANMFYDGYGFVYFHNKRIIFMGQKHLHSHSHTHDGKLSFAVFINILLSVAQIIGGLVSGSLSLIADALHNLSDAGAILIAIIARKIARRPASSRMTYGFKRAEILGALINSTTLIIVGFYLIYEAIFKYFNPEPIDGWIVVWVATIALVIDAATAWLTYKSGAKNNLNLIMF